MDHRSLTAHVPVDRLVGLATGHALPAASEGAALFADLAGFTPLTNALAGLLGPRRGAEALTRHLNRVYDALVAEVHRFGGAVVDFSGDAILCWFGDPAADGGAPAGAVAGARRAATCGWAMQRVIAGVGSIPLPDGDEATLSLKVAVAVGPVLRAVVGDPAVRVVDVVAGDTVARTAAAERAAGQGEVVLDERAASALRATVTVGTWRDGVDGGRFAVVASLDDPAPPTPWPDVAAGEPATDVVRTWVDVALRDRPEERVTELRASVALFVRFGGIDFDGDPAAGAALDAYVRWVQGVLLPHGGTLIQVTIGDKGSYLYVAFGAPVAHEDIADRAVACALDLCDPPAGLGGPVPPAAGLDQGVARCGSYGGSTRRTYGVIGDATNTAARLMTLAGPGEILVTGRVRRACRRRIAVEELAPVRVKGQLEPVEVARIAGRTVAGGTGRVFGALVGRDAELARIDDVLDAVRRGPAGTVVIEGEAGIGKSHLVDVARRTLLSRDEVTWLTVAADETRRSPLQPFVAVLRDVFYQDLVDDPESRRGLFDLGIAAIVEAVAGLGPDGAAAAAAVDADQSYVAALVGVRWEGSPYQRHDPATRFDRCLRAVEALLRAEALRRPVVVHVRDAHWLDDDSRRLVDRLGVAAADVPLCVVVDRRPDDRAAADTAVAAGTGPVVHVALGALDAAGTARLASSLLDGPIAPSLAEHLAVRTRGNPLFVEQLALDLHDRGAVRLDAVGAWELADAAALGVPVTLTAVLVSRLDRLPEGVRRAAQSAAVLGESFEPDVLAALLALDGGDGGADGAPEPLRAVLDAGALAGVWFPVDGGSYAFRHALLRDAAYDVQLDDRLRELHARAVVVLQAAPGRGLGPAARAAELAHHEERAGRPWRATAHLRRAGAAYEAQSMFRSACRQYQHALDVAQHAGLGPRTLARLHQRAGDAAHAIGDHETSVEHLRAALAVDPALAPAAAVGVVTRLGEALDRWGHEAEAEAAFEQAIGLLQSSPDLATASRIYAGLAMVHGRRHELDAAVDLADVALAFAAGDDALTARAHQGLCILEGRRERLADAATHGERSLALWEALDDHQGIAAAHNNLGLVDEAAGDGAAAARRFGRAVEQFDLIGNEHGLACALDNLARVLLRSGEEEAGMACLERAVEILARIGMGSRGVVPAMWQSGSW